jgi:nucleotide-binding universal stress UspA family protein
LNIAVREILCATDVEKPAYAGLRYSFFLADRFQCALEVVHASREASSMRPHYLSGAERMAQALETHRLRQRLDAVVRSIPTGIPGRATTRVMDGTVREAVLERSERQRADLIVLDATARLPARKSASESVAEWLTHQTSCPILTVPARDDGPAPKLRRILLVLEPEPSVGLAVEWTALWAERFGAHVQLLYRAGSGGYAPTREASCRNDVEDKLRRAGASVEASFEEPGSRTANRVVARAELGACDLVVMSSVLRDDGDPCVVESLRRASSLPVLSVRDFVPDGRFVANGAQGPSVPYFASQAKRSLTLV